VDLFEDEASSLVERHRRLACVDSLNAASQLLQLSNGGPVVRAKVSRQRSGFSALGATLFFVALGVHALCQCVCSVAVDAGVAVAASDHAAIDGALHDIDVHLIAVSLHEIATLILLNGLAAAAIEILRDAAPVVVFATAVGQHQIDDDGGKATLLLPDLSMVGDVHVHLISVGSDQAIEKCVPETSLQSNQLLREIDRLEKASLEQKSADPRHKYAE
jgi:hypothetical protein